MNDIYKSIPMISLGTWPCHITECEDWIRIWLGQIDWVYCLIIHLKSLSIIAFCTRSLKINSWHHFCWQPAQDGHYMRHWGWGRMEKKINVKNIAKIFRLHHNPQSWNWLLCTLLWKRVTSWVSNFHADNIRTFRSELGHITREKWKFPDVKIISQSPRGTRCSAGQRKYFPEIVVMSYSTEFLWDLKFEWNTWISKQGSFWWWFKVDWWATHLL